jgi:hypothetical protein
LRRYVKKINGEGKPMTTPKRSISEFAKSRISEIALSLLAMLGTIVIPHFDPSFLEKIFPGMTELDYKKVCLILLLYLVLLSAYVVLLKWQESKKPNFKDYEFDPIDQCWRHKTKQVWLCASCKVDNIFSPLAFTDDGDMICPKCDKTAKNHKLKTMLTMSRFSPSVCLENFAKKENT